MFRVKGKSDPDSKRQPRGAHSDGSILHPKGKALAGVCEGWITFVLFWKNYSMLRHVLLQKGGGGGGGLVVAAKYNH